MNSTFYLNRGHSDGGMSVLPRPEQRFLELGDGPSQLKAELKMLAIEQELSLRRP